MATTTTANNRCTNNTHTTHTHTHTHTAKHTMGTDYSSSRNSMQRREGRWRHAELFGRVMMMMMLLLRFFSMFAKAVGEVKTKVSLKKEEEEEE